MAFAAVQQNSAVGTTANPSVSFSGTPSNGNLLVIVFSSTTKTVADVTLPAGYAARVEVDDSAGGCLIIADRLASSTGKPQTLTCTSGGNWDLAVFEWSGVAASGYFDKASSTDYGSVNAATPGSLTPDNATELMVAAARHANTSSGEAVDSGFTKQEDSTLSRLVIATKIKTTGTAENPSLSWTTASDALAGMVAYSTTTITPSTGDLPDRHLPRGVARGVTRGVT